MIYLASPYTGTPAEQQARYEAAEKATAVLLKRGHVIYSPIVHCHYLAMRHDLPGTIDFWHWYDQEMLSRSDELWILMLEGWASSKGIRFEYDIAEKLNKPVSLVNTNDGFAVYPNFLGFTSHAGTP